MAEHFAPYAPPENMERLFTRVRSNGWPPRVNVDYLMAVGLSEGNIPRVISALKFLNIINDDGTVTDLGESLHLASEEEWPAVLQDALRTSYADIFRVVNPEAAPRQAVRDAFRPMKPTGQQERMTTLFLGLCVMASMDVQDRPTQRPGLGVPKKAKIVTRKPRVERSNGKPLLPALPAAQVTQPTYRLTTPGALHPSLAGILQAVPELETADDLERWIESFRATFLMVKKVSKEARI